MAKITVEIPQESKDFLTNYVIFEDAARNQSEAVNWCIDSCIKIEKKYGVDACYVAHNNIVLETLKDNQKEGNKEYHVKFADMPDMLIIHAGNTVMAGIMAHAHWILEKGVVWPIDYILHKESGHKIKWEYQQQLSL